MRLFISYARSDTQQIKQLVEILRSGGHDPWFDHALTVGADWQKELLRAIRECEVFVYALTTASAQSEWCLWEFAQAIDMDKPVIPVLIEAGMEIPEFLDHRQYADFREGATPEAVARLMHGIYAIRDSYPRSTVKKYGRKPEGAPSRADVDDLYNMALAIAREHHGVSIRLLARKLNIGETRAGRIVDALETRGIIGKFPGGSKLRPLLEKENDKKKK